MEELIVDCCIKFLKLAENCKESGKITQEQYNDMVRSKIEFLSNHGYLDYKKSPGLV